MFTAFATGLRAARYAVQVLVGSPHILRDSLAGYYAVPVTVLYGWILAYRCVLTRISVCYLCRYTRTFTVHILVYAFTPTRGCRTVAFVWLHVSCVVAITRFTHDSFRFCANLFSSRIRDRHFSFAVPSRACLTACSIARHCTHSAPRLRFLRFSRSFTRTVCRTAALVLFLVLVRLGCYVLYGLLSSRGLHSHVTHACTDRSFLFCTVAPSWFH